MLRILCMVYIPDNICEVGALPLKITPQTWQLEEKLQQNCQFPFDGRAHIGCKVTREIGQTGNHLYQAENLTQTTKETEYSLRQS